MNEVKLIIWDLDDTLWQGTLAEQEDVILKQAVVNKIQFLLDRGIVHSICSKNDEKKAKATLNKLGIADLFIFPSIAFADKGFRVKKIIELAQLRPQNVLFIDDNAFVLREVAFHNPLIMTQLIDDFMQIDVTQWGKKDSQRQRLAQYKILETKEQHRTTFLETNQDEYAFLQACAIEIQLTPLTMGDPDIERIIELVNRSNQMNFTQSRIKYDYLFTLFELKNGINFKVQVKDKYGHYGVVGYICILNNTLLHYVFSCRILGMCVEAKLYQWLHSLYPTTKTSFNVNRLKHLQADLNFITVTLTQGSQIQESHENKVLVRGPCLANAISFLLSEHYHVEEEIFSFFEFANLNFLRKNIHQKNDKRFEKTQSSIKKNDYRMIVNFLESDYYSGHYKIHNQLVPLASNYIYWKSLRSIKNDNQMLSEHIEALMVDGMRNIEKFNLGSRFSPWPRMEKMANKTLNWFGPRWRKSLYQLVLYCVYRTYCGYVSVKQFEKNIKWYVGLFSTETRLVFINPPEKIRLPLLTTLQNKKILKRTQKLNSIMRLIAQEKANVILLEMDEIITQDDIIDSFSHLKRVGYIKLSQALLSRLEQ